jgi:hypothetical protein
MLPLPPVIAWTLAAVAATTFAKILTREWQRVNAELDAQQAAAAEATEHVVTLRRDPLSGIYRPE